MNVQKRQKLGIFINLFGGNFPFHNFTKHAIGHSQSIQYFLYFFTEDLSSFSFQPEADPPLARGGKFSLFEIMKKKNGQLVG